MRTRLALPDPRLALRALLAGRARLATLARVLGVLAAIALSAGPLAAQCTTRDPPCPEEPDFELNMWDDGVTVTGTQYEARFTVLGARYASYNTAQARLNGVPAPGGIRSTTANGNVYTVQGYVILSTASMAAGANTLTVTFCDVYGGCATGQATLYYYPPPPPPARGAPIVAVEPNGQYRKSFAGCAGCVYGTIAYSTPSYRSLDQDRSLTFVYSSATATPLALVVLDATTNSTDAVAHMSVELYLTSGPDPSTARELTTGGQRVYYAAGPGTNRLSAQFDASALPTAVHTVRAVVRNHYVGGGETQTSYTFPLLVVNQKDSEWGRGWGLAGLHKTRALSAYSDMAVSDGAGNVQRWVNCGYNCWTPPPGEASQMTVDAVKQVRTYPDGAQIWYDLQGRMTRTQDRFGQGTSYAYDAAGRLASVTDPAGHVTTVAWVANGDGTTSAVVTTPGGRVSRLVRRDDTGDLVQILEPRGGPALVLGYEEHQLRWSTDYLTGGTTYYAYDIYGGLSSMAAPAIQTVDQGSVAAVTTFQSREATLLPPRWTNGVRVYPDSAWIRVVGPGGDSTRILVNGEGNATYVVTKDLQGKEQWAKTVYNAAGQPEVTSNSAGGGATYDWSSATVLNGSLLMGATTYPGGISTTYGYNSLGQLTTTTVEGTERTKILYSADARSVPETAISGTDTTRVTFDARGRVLTVRDPEGHLTTRAYQGSGWDNTQSMTLPSGTTSFTYDGYGRPQTVTDPASRTATTYYDALNRVTQVTDPAGLNSFWGHDDANRRYTFTDANSQRYETWLNALGMPYEATDPRGQISTIGYDARGLPVQSVTRRGKTITRVYDELSRLRLVAADGDTTHFSHDTASTWVAYRNAEGTDSVFTDGEGRVSRQVAVRAGKVYTLTSGYGELGNRQSLKVESSSGLSRQLTFGVDTYGRPKTVDDFAGRGTTIGYNKDDLPSLVTMPTNLTSTSTRLQQTTTYTADHGVQSEAYNYLTQTLNRTYGYDVLARAKTVTSGSSLDNRVRTLEYDVMGRMSSYVDVHRYTVKEWVCSGGTRSSCGYQNVPVTETELAESYMYDAVGNPVGPGTSSDPGNRLIAHRGYVMWYDADGNMTRRAGNGGVLLFQWDALGQLAQVTDSVAGVTTKYGYDGLGRRVRKTVSGDTTYYLYDGANLVMQLDASGNPQLEFSYYPGVDRPHAVRRSSDGAVFYYVQERPGHVTALVNTSNQAVNTYRYEPFGKAIAVSEQVPQPFRFTGREFDSETGLYYYRARYYDPALNRFISEDPIGLAGGVNPYAFVGNDPLNATDPFGLSSCRLKSPDYTYIDASGRTWTMGGRCVDSAIGWAEFMTWVDGFAAGLSSSDLRYLSGHESHRQQKLKYLAEAARERPAEARACTASAGFLGMSVASDVGTFGAGKAFVGTAKAGLQHSMRATVLRGAFWHPPATEHAAAAVAAQATARLQAYELANSVGQGALVSAGATFSETGALNHPTDQVGALDFIPIVGTLFKSLPQAVEACGNFMIP